MNLKIAPIFSVLVALFAFSVNTYADMTVFLRNDTDHYIFYFNHHKISSSIDKKPPYTVTLKNHTTLPLTMDCVTATPRVCSIGKGSVTYSIDPKSKQRNVSISIGPAVDGLLTTAPTFHVMDEDVNSRQHITKYSWKTGMHLVFHANSNRVVIFVKNRL